MPAMYDQWCDPEIHFDDDIVNESLYQHASNNFNDQTEQLMNEFDTCSIINTNEFVYEITNDINDYDCDDDVDDEIATATENKYLEYDLSMAPGYEFISHSDAIKQKSMATSVSPLWLTNGSADSTMNSNNINGRGSSLSGDATPFVPASQFKPNRKYILVFFFSLFLSSMALSLGHSPSLFTVVVLIIIFSRRR